MNIDDDYYDLEPSEVKPQFHLHGLEICDEVHDET